MQAPDQRHLQTFLFQYNYHKPWSVEQVRSSHEEAKADAPTPRTIVDVDAGRVDDVWRTHPAPKATAASYA